MPNNILDFKDETIIFMRMCETEFLSEQSVDHPVPFCGKTRTKQRTGTANNEATMRNECLSTVHPERF